MKTELFEIQKDIEDHGMDRKKHDKEKAIYTENYNNNRKDEEKWWIKSINLWLHAGDKNASYFHRKETLRKFKDAII